jgi:site-specific DNA recombinase
VTRTNPNPTPATNSGGRPRSKTVDYVAEAKTLITHLRKRDTDPDYADAPVIDTYARISKIAKHDDGEKTERQTFDVLKRLEGEHVRLGRVLVDNNRSAWKRNGRRPDFELLLDRLTNNESDGAIVWHVDRLMRQPWDLERLIDVVIGRRKGKRTTPLYSCFGDYMDWSTDQVLQLRIATNFAEKESADKSRRLLAKAQSLRANGNINGVKNIFGHRYHHDTDVSDDRLRAERDAVIWGIDQLVAGAPLTAVADGLNERGVTTRAGYAFTPQKVRQTLYSARHAGIITDPDGAVVGPVGQIETLPLSWRDAGLSEAIVSPGTWALLEARFRERKRGRPLSTHLHALTGSIFCGNCGTRMSGELSKVAYSDTGEPRRNYRCPPRGCNSNTVDARYAEEWVTRIVVANMANPTNAANLVKRSKALADVEAQIAAATEIRTAMAAALGNQEIEYGEYSAFVATQNIRGAELTALRAALIEQGAQTSATVSDLSTTASDWLSLPVVERKRIIAGVIPHGVAVAKASTGTNRKGYDAVAARLSLRKIEDNP